MFFPPGFWILTPGSLLYAPCPMLYAFNTTDPLCLQGGKKILTKFDHLLQMPTITQRST